MKPDLYGTGALPFWTARQIARRRHATERLVAAVGDALLGLNQAWLVTEVEGPLVTPRDRVGAAYDGGDIWLLEAPLLGATACLRPETTPSTYAAMRAMLDAGEARLPFCCWQAGKSFRRETNDGASPAKLRFQEFWQLELQCGYADGTKADYRAAVQPAVLAEIGAITGREVRLVPSERLPPYSAETVDVEASRPGGRWTEMASLSTRTDFPRPGVTVLEVAIGLDRLVRTAEETGF